MQKCYWIFVLLTCFILQGCTSIQMSEQLAYGKIKYCEGNYRAAFCALYPVAQRGNPQAEYAIGYMYYYGFGAPESMELGIYWLRKAAKKNYACAIQALNLIYAGPSTCFGVAAEESFGPPACMAAQLRPPRYEKELRMEQDIVLRTIEGRACEPLPMRKTKPILAIPEKIILK